MSALPASVFQWLMCVIFFPVLGEMRVFTEVNSVVPGLEMSVRLFVNFILEFSLCFLPVFMRQMFWSGCDARRCLVINLATICVNFFSSLDVCLCGGTPTGAQC